MSDDVVSRIDSLIPADEVNSHPLVWRARNIDLALLIDARNEIRALRRANAGMVGRAEHARVVGDLTREAERLRARVEEFERADRTPRPPEELVGALHDRIHLTSGRLIHSSPIAPPTQEAKP